VYVQLRKRTRVLVVSGDEVIVVRGWLSNGKWSLPGGGLKRKEDHKVGVLRELLEEVGVSLPKEKLNYIGRAKQKKGLRFTYFRYVSQTTDKPKLKRQKGEIIATKWAKLEELNHTNAEDHVLQTIAAWRAKR
jgi:ADP-ribose pyrophosphatase YjhB (NUDIX family)